MEEGYGFVKYVQKRRHAHWNVLKFKMVHAKSSISKIQNIVAMDEVVREKLLEMMYILCFLLCLLKLQLSESFL